MKELPSPTHDRSAHHKKVGQRKLFGPRGQFCGVVVIVMFAAPIHNQILPHHAAN